MFSKIFSSLSLANAFKGFLFKRISSPMQSARIISMVLDIKNAFNDSKDQASSICKTLDLIVNFKKEHPQDFCRRKNKISIWKNKTSIKVEILFFYKP